MALKTVNQHNQEKIVARQEAEKKLRMTGVACPECGKELEWDLTHNQYPMYQMMSYPPPTTAKAQCRSCSLTIDLEK